MSNDIRDIINRLATVESRLTPVGVKKGLNPQQKSVPQLPALFKPHGIKALGAKTDPAHPMKGYMVGDSVEPKRTALEEAMAEIEEDMLSKVKKDLTQYLDKLERKVAIDRALKDKALDAVERGEAEEDIEEFAPPGGDDGGPGEEEILRRLAAQWWHGDEDPRAERALAAMGWEIGQDESGDDDAGVFVIRAGDVNGNSYMAFPQSELNLDEEIDTGPAAMHGPSDPLDSETGHAIELNVANQLAQPQAPQATFEMADGSVLECWGDDNTGYEIRHGKRRLPSKFKSLDDAGMAVRLYKARKQRQDQQDLDQDYIEER